MKHLKVPKRVLVRLLALGAELYAVSSVENNGKFDGMVWYANGIYILNTCLFELWSKYVYVIPCFCALLIYRRFMVADDPLVDRFMIRDIDSRLGPRDAAAVQEWIASRYSVHSMRDHPMHGTEMMGGIHV